MKNCLHHLILIFSIFFIINKVNAQFIDTVCINQEKVYKVLYGDSGSTYEWIIADKNIQHVSNADSLIVFWGGTPGEYVIKVLERKYGCQGDTFSGTVIVKEKSDVDLGPSTTSICFGDSLMLYPGTYKNYIWQDNSTDSSLIATESGKYWVKAQGDCGWNSDTLLLTIDSLPRIDIGEVEAIKIGNDIQLFATQNKNYSYNWTPGELLDDSTIYNPIAYVDSSTYFTIRVIDEKGCANIDSIFVTVIKYANVEIYNAFTPDGDGVNETFYIENIETFKKSHLEIYNRAGNIIYKTDNYQNDWHGTYQRTGKKLPIGTYYYILDLRDGNSPIIKGNVTIAR